MIEVEGQVIEVSPSPVIGEDLLELLAVIFRAGGECSDFLLEDDPVGISIDNPKEGPGEVLLTWVRAQVRMEPMR